MYLKIFFINFNRLYTSFCCKPSF